jgi:glycosyltransferase involved in cell wall biosynthesis
MIIPAPPIPASVCIIARDEEARIGRCLDSVSGFDEIIFILDSASSDRTGEIARAKGCRVFVEDWKGFGRQKQSTVDKARNNWVLLLDSDEKLPPETKKEISRVLRDPGHIRAFAFPRKNFLHGRWMRHADFWPDWQIRLVDRRYGRLSSEAVHERWALDAGHQAKRLSAPIEHYSFNNYSDMLNTMNRYSSLIAEDLFRNGKSKNVHALGPVFHAGWMFFRIYFVKRGFLDGFDGFVTALLKAAGSFFKYAKLLELERTKGRSP